MTDDSEQEKSKTSLFPIYCFLFNTSFRQEQWNSLVSLSLCLWLPFSSDGTSAILSHIQEQGK